MSLGRPVEKRGNFLTKLEYIPGIAPIARAIIHLSNAINDPTIPGDFKKVAIFNQTPIYNDDRLAQMFGESQYQIIQRLKQKLGNRGIIYRFAENRFKRLIKK